MKIENYTKKCLETLSRNFDNNSVHKDLLHSIMGLVTESAELKEAFKIDEVLDIHNVKEEYGDLLWYLAIGYNSIGHPIHSRNNIWKKEDDIKKEGYGTDCLDELADECVILSGKLLDLCRRSFYYGQPKNSIDENKVLSLFDDLFLLIIKGAIGLEATVSDIMDINIRKLHKVRYKNNKTGEASFDTVAATERDLNKERQIIEKG